MTSPTTTTNGTAVLDAYIIASTDTRAGKPRLTGRRITVADVAGWHVQQGRPVEEIVAEYDLSHAQVYAALAYYYEHREAIDQREADDLAAAESIRHRYPSKLQAKLTADG